MINFAAWTAPGCDYPQYLSINEIDGIVEVTIRATRGADGSCGPTISVKLQPDEYKNLLKQMNEAERQQCFGVGGYDGK